MTQLPLFYLSGHIRRREGCAIVSVLKDNADPMSGLSQLRDDACRLVSIDYGEKWALSAAGRIEHCSPPAGRSAKHSRWQRVVRSTLSGVS